MSAAVCVRSAPEIRYATVTPWAANADSTADETALVPPTMMAVLMPRSAIVSAADADNDAPEVKINGSPVLYIAGPTASASAKFRPVATTAVVLVAGV